MGKVIKIENLSKAYQLGEIGTGTLSRDLERSWAKMRGKDDPFLKIGEVNDRTIKGVSDVVWALKNINLEVEEGEAIGIIGRNGAGKSTLLKLLSRVTAPTAGSVKVKGRIASLLEVGTGFHAELSGRENIYLNGAILGMRKAEIKNKFDEIVDFSGVERYIDTPVKRYSSGMYVRLAFAVAAHLESEILIVDEVLAVGDAEFQKKCLGRMKDASVNGRTVLFVTHDMQSISTLTKKAIFLKNGEINFTGNTFETIQYYLSDYKINELVYVAPPMPDRPTITKVELQTSLPNNVQETGKELRVSFEVEMPTEMTNMALSFQIQDLRNMAVIHSWVFDTERPILRKKGTNKLVCIYPKINLYMGKYSLIVHFAQFNNPEKFETLYEICPFEVVLYGKDRGYNWAENACVYFEDNKWTEL